MAFHLKKKKLLQRSLEINIIEQNQMRLRLGNSLENADTDSYCITLWCIIDQ